MATLVSDWLMLYNLIDCTGLAWYCDELGRHCVKVCEMQTRYMILKPRCKW
jgi:hypothetical protein